MYVFKAKEVLSLFSEDKSDMTEFWNCGRLSVDISLIGNLKNTQNLQILKKNI